MQKKYDPGKIEKKWQRVWKRDGVFEPNLKKARKPFYNLMMFPYPSAEGLHVGNMYAFTGSDIYGRYKRMRGFDVFEPIGLDGFGIHSENYAIKIGAHPMKQVKVSEKRFYKQLELVGNGFAWKEHAETYDPEYYKWTQWIFVQMFKNGLAYRKEQSVNWCPSCKTVLADEQVIAGECERCGSKVEKKNLEQWFFKITEYADQLLKNIDKLDWSEKVKIAQRNWIGKSEGAEIVFPIKESREEIKVFTTRPDTLYGATYLVLAPEHPFIQANRERIFNWDEVEEYIEAAAKKSDEERIADGKEKTGVELMGLKAVNPATKHDITIWVADYVLGGYGTGAIMAVPAHDERDFEFAKKFNIPVRPVIDPSRGVVSSLEDPIEAQREIEENILKIKRGEMVYTGSGKLTNSGPFDGLDIETGGREIVKHVNAKFVAQYHLRDWLISRQRYWGPPIPMIFCSACAEAKRGERHDMPGWYAVPEKQLPVKLPFMKDFRPQGEGRSPLASVKSFYETKCPVCKGKARRETDVSDTFLDSAWYYLRYPSVHEKRAPWNPQITKKWLPVDMYIGGAEHAVLHLLYMRFLAMVFHDWKLVPFEEPATKFRAHGLLIKEGAKMSKSKGNVVNPDEYVKRFGADTLRMYLMFLAPFEQGGDFRDQAVLGVARFLDRVWKKSQIVATESFTKNRDAERPIHRAVKKVTEDIEALRYNTAISALMILLNDIEDAPVSKEQWLVFVKLLAPFAPHITEEIWHEFGKTTSIHREKWPAWDPKKIAEAKFTIAIQVNGKLRDTLEVDAEASDEEVRELVLKREKIQAHLNGAAPKRVIYIPKRLVNIVV